MSRELTIPSADTRLHAVDTPGGAPPLLLLNGGFGTVRNWDRVVQRIAGRYRVIRFDARGRGRSGRSADYSIPGAVDDVGRVIEATGLDRPVLVGWSHGATVAVRYAADHPDLVSGLVLIDGAYPIAMFDEAGHDRVRAQFRRYGWIMRILAALGRSARLSPDESADVVLGMDAVNGGLEADLAKLTCPTVYVVGTGVHSGGTDEDLRTMRGSTAKAVASNPRVSVYATVPVNHVRILSKASDIVVDAIDAVVRDGSR